METEKKNEVARAAALREVRAREEAADTQKADEFAARIQFVQDKTGVTAKQEKVSKFIQEQRDTREELVETLSTGDISTTLGILRDASILDGVKPQYRKAFDLVTKELQKLDFTQVNVVLENKADPEKTLPAGRDAQYDPATNTLLLSSAGAVNGATIQHELIHSATVKVIRDYQDAKARKELTPTQQQGVEHLMRIFDFVKKQKTTAGKPFPEYFSGAMESVYEFVAYGMTEPAFQKELAQLHSQNLRPQGKGGKNLWKQFMDAVASVLNIADKEGNVLAELSSTFRQILASPTDVVLGVAPLSVRRRARVAVPPESMPPSDADALEESSRRKLEPKERKTFDFKEFMRYWFRSREGIERFIQRAANVNRPIQTLRRSMALRGTLKMSGPDANDAASYIDAAPSLIEMNIKYLQPTVDKLRGYIQELSQRTGRGYKDELARISTYLKAETVQQRRNDKYMRDVPLSTTRNIKLRNGKVVSAADLRETIYSRVMKPDPISDTERNALYKTLETLVFADATAKTPSKYVDPLGYTTADLQASRRAKEQEQTYTVSDPRPTDFNDPVFDIIAGDQTTPRWSPDAVEQVLGRMRDDPNQELIQKIRDTVMEIDAETRKFNAQSGYLSAPAQNFIKFYKWDKYVPLKGKPDKNGELNTVSELDYTLYDNGPNFGAAYRLDYLPGFDGRGDEPDDPILMTIIDASRAATRAGRAGLMPAVANLVRQGRIPGKVYDDELITFEDRHNRAVNLDRFRASNLFFDYKENGDIVVIRIDDPRFIEALRPEYHGTEAVRRVIDRVTSTMASGHTRYNIKFAPYDFVRNVFFNAQALFKEYGPEFGAKYFMNVTRAVFMEGRMKATWRISTAFHTNKLSDLKRMAESDPFYAAAHEYLEKGGRVAYVQSYQSQKQLDGELSVLSKGKSTFDGAMDKARFWADRWADMFELVARVEAYRLAKDYNLNVREMSQNDAVQDAIYLTKNLTNFQKRGGSQASKWVNSMFMFTSPAMTGAVAAYDVLRDGAIFDLDKEFERESTDLKNKVTKAENALNRARKFVGTEEDKAEKITKAQKDLDTVQAEYESEKQTFVKNLKPKIRNSRLLATTMMGTGAVIYLMALAVSEEDEYGRNAVTIDDKALWARNARLPTTFITGDKDSRPINLPWGFGPGALAAAGAQFAAYATGGAEFKDTFGNTISIATDSFLPIPAARYNPLDSLGAWFITSLTPSAARPFVEMTLNVDSLGREIYRENYSRYGAVYSGTDNMQNAYKDFTAFLEKQTDGEVQLDPSIVRHLTSAYFDAIGSYVADGADLASLALGRREFNAKQDLLVIDSFIGAKTSYDAKKFAEIEGDIKEKRQRYNAAMNSPHPNVFVNYQINNAKDQFMVETYNQYVSEINDVRSEMKKIRSAPLQPKERDEMLKMLRFQRDMLMKNATERIDEIDKIF